MTSSRVDHYFCEVIGLNSESSYNDTLALFNHKLKVPGKGIILMIQFLNLVTKL